MRKLVSWLSIFAACILAPPLLASPSALAADAASFYNGRNVNLIEGFNVGGGADLYTRLIAGYLARHIPGRPNVVVHNMPGAGSMTAANHVFNVSPRDGSEIGLFAGNIAVDPVIGGVPSQYDSRKFNWIGAPAAETARAAAVVAVLESSEAGFPLVETHGLSFAEAGEASAAAVSAIIADLRRLAGSAARRPLRGRGRS